jgi:hypothetical protein
MNFLNRGDTSAIGLQWLFKQAHSTRWNLNYSDLAKLLSVSEESIKAFESALALGMRIEVSENTRNRLSMLLSINKAIHGISPYGEENSFFTSPNNGSFLKGISIKEFLVQEATTQAMDKVITWLKSHS